MKVKMIIFFILSAVVGSALAFHESAPQMSYVTYVGQNIILKYPSWREVNSEGSLIAVSNKICTFTLSEISQESCPVEELGDYAVMNLSVRNMQSTEMLINCGKPYKLKFVCPNIHIYTEIVSAVFDSAVCTQGIG